MTGSTGRHGWRERREAAAAEADARRKASFFPDWVPPATRAPKPPSQSLTGFWLEIYTTTRSKHLGLVRREIVADAPYITKDEFVALYEAQRGRCALTGREFADGPRTAHHFTLPGVPSLDRIDQRKGYVAGNVRLVIFEANRARGDGDDEELVALCHDIIAHMGGRPVVPSD